MSTLDQKQTSASRSEMPALPPKADMFSVEIDVCFVPLTDVRAVRGAPARTIVALILCPTETDGRRFVGKQYQAV